MASTVIITLYQKKVQVGEKFRIDCTQTFLHPGDHNLQTMTITLDGQTFDILTNKYLDFAFSTAGSKTITVDVVHSGQGHPAVQETATIEVVTAASENLFSEDSDLISHEPDILSYLHEYKADYRYAHRLAQESILNSLDEANVRDSDGNRLTSAAIVDVEEVRYWSKYQALAFIFEALSNQVDDIFSEKAARYRALRDSAKNRAVIRFDQDGDGVADEEVTFRTTRLIRR